MIETYALQVFGTDLTTRTTLILVSFDKSISNNLVKKNIILYLYLKTLTKCNELSVNSMIY